MSKDTYDKEIAKAIQEGFKMGYEALIHLISDYEKSHLKPMPYLLSKYPNVPHHCLHQYFFIINQNWMMDGIQEENIFSQIE